MYRELLALLVLFGGVAVADNAEKLQCIIEDSHSDTCMMLLHGGNGDPEPVGWMPPAIIDHDAIRQMETEAVELEDCRDLPPDDEEYC
jgi:hypothetical protein